MPVSRKFDPEKLKVAKQKFEQGNRSSHQQRNFEEWLSLFSNDCLRFADIARQFGITRQAVSLVYSNIFAPLFPTRSGHRRRNLCTLKQWTRKAREESSGDPVLQEVAERVRKAGHTVALVLRKKKVQGRVQVLGTFLRRLVIDGNEWGIRFVSGGFRNARSMVSYTKVSFSLAEVVNCQGVIIWQRVGAIDRIFQVPASVIVAWLGNKPERSYFIRWEKRTDGTRGKEPELNLFEYETDW